MAANASQNRGRILRALTKTGLEERVDHTDGWSLETADHHLHLALKDNLGKRDTMDLPYDDESLSLIKELLDEYQKGILHWEAKKAQIERRQTTPPCVSLPGVRDQYLKPQDS